MRYKFIIATLAVLMAGSVALGIWTSSNHKNKSGSTSTTTQNQSGSTNQPQTKQQNKTYPVIVYFSKHPQSDNEPSQTFAVNRISPDLGVADFAVTQLLKGPTAAEANQGYFTTARLQPGNTTSDFRLTISNGTATLQFLKPFDHLGVVADGQADSELKATLKQFSSVNKVVILNHQGNCEFDLSGQNLCKQ